VAVLPDKSVAVHKTIVFPIMYIIGALLANSTLPQLSFVIGSPRLMAGDVQLPKVAGTILLGGQIIEGGWLSITVTDWVQLIEPPVLSVANQMTKVVPTGKFSGALLVTNGIVQLSEVVACPNATFEAKHCPGSALTVRFIGHRMVGGWLSTTVTVCEQLAVFPAKSVTVQITVFKPKGRFEEALFTTIKTWQLSVARGVPRLLAAAVQIPGSVWRVSAGGQTIDGGSLSVTVML
jgi:hypothetical protein